MKFTLTREQRAAIFAGNCPYIGGEGDPPCRRGDIKRLSKNVSLEVRKVNRDGEKWWLAYTIRDKRYVVRNMRRTPPVHVEEATPPTPKAIAEAAEESAYTPSLATSLADGGEAPPVKEVNRFARDAYHREKLSNGEDLAHRDARSQTARLKRLHDKALRSGMDISIEVEQRLDEIEQIMGEAA